MMDQDLQDLLALWLSDADLPEERRAALLGRLRSDAAFRSAFVEEIRLLGMLRAVQSAEPRWLRLEDETGWAAVRPADSDTLALRVTERFRRWRRRRLLLRWSAAAAAAVLVAVGLVLAFRPGPAPDPERPPATPAELATAIKVDDVHWEPGSATPAAGGVVTAGRLRLRSGRLTLAFFSGVALTVEGPADLELRAADRVFCHHGKLRARVPRGAEGFAVLGPGFEILDLGTEFGLNLEPGGKSRVMVFQGEAAVSMLGTNGSSVRTTLLEGKHAVEIDPQAGRMQEVAVPPEAFVPLAEYVPPPLELDARYAGFVLASRPWGYWRFASLADGLVPNEVAGRPALAALGGVEIERLAGGNHVARFYPDRPAQAFLLEDTWTPPRADGYAIELWVLADLPSPNALGQTALVSLIAADEPEAENHLAYLELSARGQRSPHEPCAVRFLDRWPPAQWGGANAITRRAVVTSLWRHVVGQMVGDHLEVYVDGECVGKSPLKASGKEAADAVTTACRLLVGRLKQRSHPPFASEIRAFVGRLAELAVYDHPLTAEEIRLHAGLGKAAVAP
jgi:hypothetical protein